MSQRDGGAGEGPLLPPASVTHPKSLCGDRGQGTRPMALPSRGRSRSLGPGELRPGQHSDALSAPRSDPWQGVRLDEL